jgi:hypothetical protein
MLDKGDEAIIMGAFNKELYPALERSENKIAQKITDAVSLHHAQCSLRETVQRFEVTISQAKNQAEEADAKASAAALQAVNVEKAVDKRFNQVWGGWRVLLVLGGVGGFIVLLLEALATMGYLHK